LEETLQAKKDFELMTERLGLKIYNYHADNRWFADNAFVQHFKTIGQGLTYCGFHAHFQNGIAEQKPGTYRTKPEQ
jgi:hypothetical protein